MKELRAYMEEVFTDYNDINEDTRMLIFSVITTVPVSMMRQERVLNPTQMRIRSGVIPSEQPPTLTCNQFGIIVIIDFQTKHTLVVNSRGVFYCFYFLSGSKGSHRKL